MIRARDPADLNEFTDSSSTLAKGSYVTQLRMTSPGPVAWATQFLSLLRVILQAAIAAAVLASVVSPLVAQTRAYRDQVTPHWFGNNSRFWYRVDTKSGCHEFIVVDAERGVRVTAFDHVQVARQLSEMLGRDVAADQLPLDQLEYSEDGTSIALVGPHGTFDWNPASQQLTRRNGADRTPSEPLFLPPRPSENSSRETELLVMNALDHPVELFWVDTSGLEHSYGKITPGESRSQHTFVGHVWHFRRADGSSIGCCAGREARLMVTLDKDSINSVQQSDRSDRRRRRNRRSESQAGNPPSPDGQSAVFVRNHDLWLKSTATSMESPLSDNATATNSFHRDAVRSRAVEMNFDQPDFPDDVAEVYWSSDSRFLLAMQTTVVQERRVSYVNSAPQDQLQPKVESYPYLKPGDELPVRTPRLFSVSDRREIPVSRDLFPNPWSLDFQRWSDDAGAFFLLYNERGHQRLRLLKVAIDSGVVSTVIDEMSDSFIHYSSEGKFELRWLRDEKVLWASERSGWNHLYRYDGRSGELLNPVTTGNWNVRRIESIDEEAGTIRFFAVGIRPEQDPYHEHFCQVHLDGTGLTILTEGDGTHEVNWSPDQKWFIDRYSRVDLPPITELRSAAGALVCTLEQGDATDIVAARGSLPERFVAKGRDGSTDIWGIVHRPARFDESLRYPVIENIYAGPHDHHVPKAFAGSFRTQQALADQGFLVVQIDGMGTAWRSRDFHRLCYRNLRDAGFPDRICWLKSLAEKYPQADISRLGIYGGSAGGQNAMAALLWHGDFYRAAVADCGCHDNRMDKIWWNEQWMGPPIGDHYQQNSNLENADKLQGQLMLVVGEMDRNVDPATTLQVARKLVQARKNFRLLVVPGAGHGACETPWASEQRTRFLLEALGSPKPDR